MSRVRVRIGSHVRRPLALNPDSEKLPLRNSQPLTPAVVNGHISSVTVQAHQQGDYAPVAGIFFMLAASAVFVGSDSVAKHLSATFVVAQILWARYTFHLLYLAALTKPRDYRRLIATGAGRLQFVRSASILTSSLCFYVALKYIPLATAAAISFIWPLVVTALSVPLLGERVGIRRWLAVFVGLGGALVIIRPGFGFFPLGRADAARYGLLLRALSDLYP